MTGGRRTHAQARAEMAAGILREGRAQVDEVGAAQLSLREIARSLGVASSALYRHVASRDELLTLLIADAYHGLADAVDAALAARAGSSAGGAASPGGPGAQTDAAASDIAALARAMRGWAVAHPRRWALLYGSPVPGYAAPPEGTTEAGTRVMGTFLALLSRGACAAAPEPSPGLGALMTAAARDIGADADAPTAAEAVGAWTALVGAISAEIFGQLGPELAAFGPELLEREVGRILRAFGLASGPGTPPRTPPPSTR